MAAILSSLLAQFADEALAKSRLAGEPEEQLRAPLEKFIQAAGEIFGLRLICAGEAHIRQVGRPDFAVYCNGALCGYIEVKQPGKGADVTRYRGHDKKQWENFSVLPNLLYTDGNEWALYQHGERTGRVIRLAGDIAEASHKAVSGENAASLEPILREFLTWQPIVPKDPRELARLLAPLCRLLREEVAASLADENSPFRLLYGEWQTTLFPGQSPDRFADAYAQTVTFSLLLAHAAGGNVLDLRQAEASLSRDNTLLAKALKIFTDNLKPGETPLSLSLLQRIVAAIPQAGVRAEGKDPWLYFYEDFLAEYDPKLRRDSGSYYTPVEVVRAMTRLAKEILVRRMGKQRGFAAPDVMTLDPAAGTGAFLLGIIAETLDPIAQTLGAGATPAYADALARRLHGFELQVGPYSVAQLRLSRALTDYGASLPPEGPKIYLTDTLESPDITPQFPSLLSRELSEQHKKALEIKKAVPILVCIGNPPYDRHEGGEDRDPRDTGGWVRWGDQNENARHDPEKALLNDFSAPVRGAGDGLHLRNLYNLYVYFWRWALWKVFEQKADNPGIVAFITASSFLEGPAFAGMRQALRRLCDDVWIIDLGGEGRGSRKEENIFNIQTPVCITLAARYGEKDRTKAAKIHYARIEGSREQKLARLDEIAGLDSLKWSACRDAWLASFTPSVREGDYFTFPLLKDLFPWQQSGVKFARTWPIASDREILARRWRALLSTADRDQYFRESVDRYITFRYRNFAGRELPAIADLPADAPAPSIKSYGYRSFDRQYCFLDARLCDRLRESLWQTRGNSQIYFATKFAQALGKGAALTLSSDVPDLDYFCNRGAKDIMPLYRNSSATQPNITPGLLEFLSREYGRQITAEDFAAYIYAVLAQNAFTRKFHEELGTREIRAPLTRDAELFERTTAIGRRLIWLHSYGERMIPEGMLKGELPPGVAKCIKAVPGTAEGYPATFSFSESAKTLFVGDGEFGPVSADIFNFEVSGLKVVQSWLKYRMKEKAGRKSSPLDDIGPGRWTAEYTEDLLRLLWILEATLALYPAQEALLAEILAGPLIKADELPQVPEEARKAPAQSRKPRQRESLLP